MLEKLTDLLDYSLLSATNNEAFMLGNKSGYGEFIHLFICYCTLTRHIITQQL